MGSFKGHSTRDLRKARSQNIRNRNVFSFAFIVFSSCSYQTKVSKDHLLQESYVFEVDTYRQLHPHSCYADRCWILLTAAKLRRFEPAHARIDGYHVYIYIWLQMMIFHQPGKPWNKEKAPPALTKIWPVAKNWDNIHEAQTCMSLLFISSLDLELDFQSFPIVSHCFPFSSGAFLCSTGRFQYIEGRQSTANFQTKSPRARNRKRLSSFYHHIMHILKWVQYVNVSCKSPGTF